MRRRRMNPEPIYAHRRCRRAACFSCALFGRQLAQKYCAQHERSTDRAVDAERLSEHERREQNGDDRIDIAENRDGLRRQIANGVKIERICAAGMNDSKHQQHRNGEQVERSAAGRLQNQRIRQQHQ